MKKELKKGDVCVKITDKNRENVKAILEMFGEEVYSNDTLINFEYIVYSVFSYAWNGALGPCKTIVKPKHLKSILANEHLKSGDYIVLDNGNEIVKIKSIYDGKIYVDKHRIKQSDFIFTDGEVLIKDFDRYATEEEIELLCGRKINGWYEDCTRHNWLAYYDFTSNKRYGFTVNGSWFRDSNLGFFDKNNITACEKKVEEALINEAKKRGLVEGAIIKSPWIKGAESWKQLGNKYKLDDNEFTLSSNGYTYTIFKNGVWAEVVDKFADLKEAHKNGAAIEFKNVRGNWLPATTPSWNSNKEYRIKPEEPIKVGDVCKFCDDDDIVYEVGSVSRIDDFFIPYQSTSGLWYTNAKKITKEEAIDLLFNKK